MYMVGTYRLARAEYASLPQCCRLGSNKKSVKHTVHVEINSTANLQLDLHCCTLKVLLLVHLFITSAIILHIKVIQPIFYLTLNIIAWKDKGICDSTSK